MTKIYVYDKDTYQYLNEQELQIDPEETLKNGETVYMFPPLNSTTIKPKEKEGYIPFYDINKKDWVLKEDLRGKKVINIETNEILTISDLSFEIKPPYCLITDKQLIELYDNKYNYIDIKKDKAIIKTREKTKEDIDKEKEILYKNNVDKYTLQIIRLKLKEQTPEIKEKINSLIKKINEEEENIKSQFKD